VVIIVNGSLGVGKTATSWALAKKFEKSAMLDGDYIGAIFPRDYSDNNWTEYLYETLAYLISFHKQNDIKNFVINYVFETPESLLGLVNRLTDLDNNIKAFYLNCNEKEQKERIIKRNNSQMTWELKRFLELNKILQASALKGDIGFSVDSSKKTVIEVAEEIWRRCI